MDGHFYRDPDRQLRLIMLQLAEQWPGLVCMDSSCQTGEPVPHMANDAGNHPHPYSLRGPHKPSVMARFRRDRTRIKRENLAQNGT